MGTACLDRSMTCEPRRFDTPCRGDWRETTHRAPLFRIACRGEARQLGRKKGRGRGALLVSRSLSARNTGVFCWATCHRDDPGLDFSTPYKYAERCTTTPDHEGQSDGIDAIHPLDARDLADDGRWTQEDRAACPERGHPRRRGCGLPLHAPFDLVLIPLLRRLGVETESTSVEDVLGFDPWYPIFLNPEGASWQDKRSVQPDLVVRLHDKIVVIEFKRIAAPPQRQRSYTAPDRRSGRRGVRVDTSIRR